jgi:hypothetical protein
VILNIRSVIKRMGKEAVNGALLSPNTYGTPVMPELTYIYDGG